MQRFAIVLFLLFGTLFARAQDVVVDVNYPTVVSVGQRFNIVWTVNASNGNFIPPAITDFQTLAGPQTSFSSSTQIVNGSRTQTIRNSYTYTLQATKEGTFEIPAARYEIKKESYSSKPITIEVTAASTSSPVTNNTTSSHSNSSSASTTNVSSDRIFLDLSVNKREVYVGEPIVATAKIYTQVNISGISNASYPSFNGFLKTDIETPQLTSLQDENVNGSLYGTGVLQQFLLYPQMSGEITIDPMSVTVLQQQRISSGFDDMGGIFGGMFGSSMFDDFFSSFQTVPTDIRSNAVKINVKPLPANRPADFSGVVGDISILSSIDKTNINVNDAITYKITISGTANLRLASTPTLPLLPDIEIYDPRINDNLRSNVSGTSGSRTFEYVLIPRHHGEYTIPSITISYFDPSQGVYKTLTTDSHTFYANKSDSSSESNITMYGGVNKENIQYIGQDIRFIKNSYGKLSAKRAALSQKIGFYSVYGILLFLFMIALFVRREHIRRNSDIVAVRHRKAGKVATKRLKIAKECISKNEKEKFYEEISKALWGYLSDKLSLQAAVLNRENIADSLLQKGVDEEYIKKLTKVIDICEYARYSPDMSETKSDDIYDEAAQFIDFLEKVV